MTNGSALADLAARIAAWTGLDLDRGVHAYVIRDMIRRRAAATGATVDSYAATVHDPSVAEAARLIDAVTVCHSWFNRDPDQLAVIEQLLAAGPADMDIWLAGCAGGEEAYTIAMLAQSLGRRPYLLGTDINTEALARARAGRYVQWSLKSLPPALADRFSQRHDGTYELVPAIRLAVELHRHNLMDAPPPARTQDGWDLILCRNVLVYFNPAQAQATLGRLARALRPGGHLILGASDTLLEPPAGLRFVSIAGHDVLQRSTEPEPARPARPERAEPGWTPPSGRRVRASSRLAVLAHRPGHDDDPVAAGTRAVEVGTLRRRARTSTTRWSTIRCPPRRPR